ncbi:aldose 1-epimerase family protein [Subsaxibacter sp. CAU 1640]|uniref:aldose 1-epimerase family protein n=1 Tax=Subsaxibacter sp. CAU 1640 TaxID=2933271 RepID=UPI002003C031|nr:aldose 1-epimerase family protein [Subsaxibacter sp. CAU 1640]MCK7591190.1 aldose 1-epimerase family protein [Subsaxibacter sp. CAU 1640]
MIQLQNEFLNIRIDKKGAELCGIASTKKDTEFMWNANPDVWANYAPNLFPIVGMLKDETYFFDGKKYSLPKHGFIRNNPNFHIIKQTDTEAVLRLSYDENTLKLYPFKFEYDVIYELENSTLKVSYRVKNVDDKTMYFSVGGHPAFKCPVYDNERYDDYQLIFETHETSETHLLDLQTGLVTDKSEPVFDSPTIIKLRHNLFDKDALIFKDLISRKVSLYSSINGTILTVHFDGFPYLGLWAKPNADYICIEPWQGIADSIHTNQQLIDKEGITHLHPNKTFKATYSIEIEKTHLV